MAPPFWLDWLDRYALPAARDQARATAHSIVGIEKAAPSLMPEGQRAVTVLVRV